MFISALSYEASEINRTSPCLPSFMLSRTTPIGA